MKNKIFIALGTTAGLTLLIVSLAAAQTATPSPAKAPLIKPVLDISASGRVNMRGTIDSVGSNSITVKSWGGDWTVNVTADSNLVRRFGDKSSLSEFTAGDTVGVQGTVNNGAAWTIDAKVLRDYSTQEKNADFSGTISNLSGSSFSLGTKHRGTVRVTVNANAKVYVGGVLSSVSALANDMVARVRGVWDRTQSTVNANWVNARTPRVHPTPRPQSATPPVVSPTQ